MLPSHAPAGAVSLLVLNLQKTPVEVDLSLLLSNASDAPSDAPSQRDARTAVAQPPLPPPRGGARTRGRVDWRLEWQLTASSLSSSEALLNGVPLRFESSKAGELPELPPLVVAPGYDLDGSIVNASSRLTAAAHSVSFVVLPEARWPACTSVSP